MRTPEDQVNLAGKASKQASVLLQELKGVQPHGEGSVEDAPERKTNRVYGAPPVKSYVDSLGGDYKMSSEVADILGVTPSVIRKWSRPPKATQAPSFYAPFGKTKVYLYTEEDIEALRQYMADRQQIISTRENNARG